jgi:enamine deaminase RidA (YjgF/YER057c/UK114 family)
MRLVLLAALICGCTLVALPQKKKKDKEEITQVLQVPRELPGAVTGETARLSFHVTPLSPKGLLSQQIRDALKALDRITGSATVLHIRAFVSGSGDLRRVRDLVSEIFTERREPLPALSLVRAGGLPMEGAQVVLEAVAAGKKAINPMGLVFIPAQPVVSGHPLDPVEPLAARALASTRQALQAAGSEASDALRVTCFLSSLENLAGVRKLVEAEYPRAALNYVQTQRAPGEAMAGCEAVTRARRKPAAGLELVAGSAPSQAAVISAQQIVFTGTQASFGFQEPDARLAMDRLRKVLEQAGASPATVALVNFYPLSSGIATQLGAVRKDFFQARQPAAATLLFEGLPSLDSGFAVDAVAVKQ